LQYVASAGSEGHKIEEVLFWKQKPAACDSRNSSINSSTDATLDSSNPAGMHTHIQRHACIYGYSGMRTVDTAIQLVCTHIYSGMRIDTYTAACVYIHLQRYAHSRMHTHI